MKNGRVSSKQGRKESPGLLCLDSIKFKVTQLDRDFYVNYIELFAGCGGLSLGLKSVGFNLTMANELSPMAAESYAYNFFQENLEDEAREKKDFVGKTVWLSSKHPRSMMGARLRENPFEYPKLGCGYTDISSDGKNLNGALVVGSIVDLNGLIKKNPKTLTLIRNSFGRGEVDLVSGGPPCQSFSMAGLRDKDAEKNSLPWEFATFVKSIQPKFVLLENVSGILRPFIGADGAKYFAWFELARTFTKIGYIPLCLHINAKNVGVPQNRPRFILLGIRHDIFKKIEPSLNDSERQLFSQPLSFFNLSKNGENIALEELQYKDISRQSDFDLFKNSFLRNLVSVYNYTSVKDAIDDLSVGGSSSIYPKQLFKVFSKIIKSNNIFNHDLRSNNDLVRRRFRIYQIIGALESQDKKQIIGVINGVLHDIDNDVWSKISGAEFLKENNKRGRFKTKIEFLRFLNNHGTKKQTQKALSADLPAPAALSIPDDACHYSEHELRTLSVREMARIQSFPDGFKFRSKITTGGKMRSFEVPQYTQVGNAVPPLLGRALGLSITELLNMLN